MPLDLTLSTRLVANDTAELIVKRGGYEGVPRRAIATPSRYNSFFEPSRRRRMGHVKGWRLFGERNQLVAEATGQPNLDDHYDNFFDCIRGDAKAPAASAVSGHYAATICHLANISARLGRVPNFNPHTETCIGDESANGLIRRRYREGHWAVPHGVA